MGLLLERSSDLIIAMLAVLKAGGAYLPLELNAPAERLGFMLADAEVAAVLTTDALAAALPAGVAALPAGSAALSPGSAPVIRLDAEAAAIEACPATPPPEAATAESLAYVMYTSGSTGRPKGVCVPHRAIVRLVLNTDYARFSADQVFLQYAPVSFDAATFEIWGALLNGARLVLMPPRQDSLEALGRTIAEQGVTTLWLTASLFNLMIDEQPAALRGLRQLLVGGEALSVEHIRRARAVLPGCRLINGYGPTECTTFSCCHTITHVGTAASIPIGGPIANRQATCWTNAATCCRSGLPASCISAAMGWHAGIRATGADRGTVHRGGRAGTAVLHGRLRALARRRHARFPRPARRRSSFADSASRPARSRRCCARCRA